MNPSASQATLDILTEPQRQAQTMKIARTALALRQLATAAAALQKLPGGGKAADGLLQILDGAVNRGGRLHVRDGKLRRTTPAGLIAGDSFLMQVAPWAMTKIGNAVQAARVGLGRFGAALDDNLRTGAQYAADKIRPLLDRLQTVPGLGAAVDVARSALRATGKLLGVGPAPAQAPAKPKTRRTVILRLAKPAQAAPSGARPAPDGAAAPSYFSGIGPKIALGVAAALVIVPKLLKH